MATTPATFPFTDSEKLVQMFSGDHMILDTGDCRCGQDGATCQVCGHRFCGNHVAWIKVPGTAREGNVCVLCGVSPEDASQVAFSAGFRR